MSVVVAFDAVAAAIMAFEAAGVFPTVVADEFWLAARATDDIRTIFKAFIFYIIIIV